MFCFIVQQVHTQPLVTAINNITSILTSTPKAITITFRLSLSFIASLIRGDGSVFLVVGMMEVGILDGVMEIGILDGRMEVVILDGRMEVAILDGRVGQSVSGVEGLLVVVVRLIVVLGQYWHIELSVLWICIKVGHV